MTDVWDMPDASEILPPGAPRTEWLAARREGIGGSDLPVLMGVNHHGSEFELWQEKTGRAPVREATGAMKRGTWLEPNIAAEFVRMTSIEVREVGLCVWEKNPLVRYTPDRLSADGGLVEIKTSNNFAPVRHEWARGGVARHAYVQMQWGLMCTGRAHGWLVWYEIDQDPIVRGPFTRDEPLHARMLERALSWWAAFVAEDTPPPVDLAKVTDDELRRRYPGGYDGDKIEAELPDYVEVLLQQRAEALAEEGDARRRKQAIDRELRAMTGAHEFLTIADEPVVRFREQEGGPQVSPAMEWEAPEEWDRWINRPQQRVISILRRKGPES